MKVLVIGSKGFLGRYAVDELNKEGYELVDFKGDARKKEDVANNIGDCKAVINLIGIIREARGKTFYNEHYIVVKNIVDVMKELKINRLIHISALGSKAGAKSQYYKTKHAGEMCIVNSGVDYTILRPSFLFGKEDRSINLFMKFVRKGFFVMFGDGNYKLQPIYVGDVAKIIVGSIKNKNASKKIFEVAGNKQYSFNELIDIMAGSINKKVRKLHVPVGLARFFALLFERFSFFPFTREQIDMLLEGNTCSNKEFNEVYGFKLKNFEDYLKEYKLI